MIGPSDPQFLPMLVLLCVMFILLLPALWASNRLSRRLRAHHPNVWQELGEPSFRNLTIASSGRSARFIRAGEYRGLSDPIVNRCATALKIVSLLYLGCFAAFVILFFVDAG